VTQCPKAWIGSDAARFVRLAELFDKGLPPIGGGALDQTKCFLDAEQAWRADMGELEAWMKPHG